MFKKDSNLNCPILCETLLHGSVSYIKMSVYQFALEKDKDLVSALLIEWILWSMWIPWFFLRFNFLTWKAFSQEQKWFIKRCQLFLCTLLSFNFLRNVIISPEVVNSCDPEKHCDTLHSCSVCHTHLGCLMYLQRVQGSVQDSTTSKSASVTELSLQCSLLFGRSGWVYSKSIWYY